MLKRHDNQEEFDNPAAYYEYKKFNKNFDQNIYNGTNILHMNINSLSYKIDDFHTLLSQLSVKFGIIDTAKTRLKIHALRTTNINLQGYSVEHTPTESTCGGSFLYINNNINYLCRNDLQIYKKKELESTFTEFIKPSGKNVIVGCIYRHPCMNPCKFNDVYLHELLQNLGNDNKQIGLMGDFNIDMLKHDKNKDSATFLDRMYSKFLLPYITAPYRITPHSSTLIDNIFSNSIVNEIFSGNITSTISDQYVQFFLTKKIQLKNNKETYKHNFKNFNEDAFKRDLENINWAEILEIENKNVNESFDNSINTFNELLSFHAPIKECLAKQNKNKINK